MTSHCSMLNFIIQPVFCPYLLMSSKNLAAKKYGLNFADHLMGDLKHGYSLTG